MVPVRVSCRTVIAYFWTLSSDATEEASQSYRFIPDGYVDWICKAGQYLKSSKTLVDCQATVNGSVAAYWHTQIKDSTLMQVNIFHRA